MESEQEALNDEIDTWKYKASSATTLATNYKEENEEISAKLKTLQDQQTQIDELTKQLADTKAQYDALKVENDATKEEQQTASSRGNSGVTSTDTTEQNVGQIVWLSATGSKYHNKPDCGNMNPNTARQISIADAGGYSACSKCF